MATTYYIDVNGNDANNGLDKTANGAWETLGNLATHPLFPGDTIILKKGETWLDQQISLNVNGELDAPITITVDDTWGTGRATILNSDAPVINNTGQNYIEYSGLTIGRNTGTSATGFIIIDNASGVKLQDIVITNPTTSDTGFLITDSQFTAKNIYFDNSTISSTIFNVTSSTFLIEGLFSQAAVNGLVIRSSVGRVKECVIAFCVQTLDIGTDSDVVIVNSEIGSVVLGLNGVTLQENTSVVFNNCNFLHFPLLLGAAFFNVTDNKEIQFNNCTFLFRDEGFPTTPFLVLNTGTGENTSITFNHCSIWGATRSTLMSFTGSATDFEAINFNACVWLWPSSAVHTIRFVGCESVAKFADCVFYNNDGVTDTFISDTANSTFTIDTWGAAYPGSMTNVVRANPLFNSSRDYITTKNDLRITSASFLRDLVPTLNPNALEDFDDHHRSTPTSVGAFEVEDTQLDRTTYIPLIVELNVQDENVVVNTNTSEEEVSAPYPIAALQSVDKNTGERTILIGTKSHDSVEYYFDIVGYVDDGSSYPSNVVWCSGWVSDFNRAFPVYNPLLVTQPVDVYLDIDMVSTSVVRIKMSDGYESNFYPHAQYFEASLKTRNVDGVESNTEYVRFQVAQILGPCTATADGTQTGSETLSHIFDAGVLTDTEYTVIDIATDSCGDYDETPGTATYVAPADGTYRFVFNMSLNWTLQITQNASATGQMYFNVVKNGATTILDETAFIDHTADLLLQSGTEVYNKTIDIPLLENDTIQFRLARYIETPGSTGPTDIDYSWDVNSYSVDVSDVT